MPDDWDFYSENSDTVFHLLYIFTVIPVTIVALALHEAVLGGTVAYKKLSKLGDISYATYMLHFPLQLACALTLGLTPAFFMHDATMLAFYAVLIGLGALVYRTVELPAQAFLRGLAKR